MHVAHSLFCGHLNNTDLVNKIIIYVNLINLFNYEIKTILFLFKGSIKICNNICKYHSNNYIYNRLKKKVLHICIFSYTPKANTSAAKY